MTKALTELLNIWSKHAKREKCVRERESKKKKPRNKKNTNDNILDALENRVKYSNI